MDVSSITFDGINCLDSTPTTPKQISQAFRDQGSGTFANVAFKNIKFEVMGLVNSGIAMTALGTDSNVNVLNSDFSEIGRVGVLYFGSGVTGLFQGNTYTGKGDGIFIDYALQINQGADIIVDRNTITGNRGVLSSPPSSTSACLLVTTANGGGTAATIMNNALTDCTSGVTTSEFIAPTHQDTSIVKLTGNTFSGILMSMADAVNWCRCYRLCES
jgi:hypothetical protein